jgi:hypothetical protein
MRIISGGQTGVDRAALDIAISFGIEYGGAVPGGRRAEDGPIDTRYDRLEEMASRRYRDRTEKNVRDADATLIFTRGRPGDGTSHTIQYAGHSGKPFLVMDLLNKDLKEVTEGVRAWLHATNPQVLNVAGPRESKAPGIYGEVFNILMTVFKSTVVGKTYAVGDVRR